MQCTARHTRTHMQLWLTLAGTGCLATADTGWTAVRAHGRAAAAERFSSCCRCIFRKGPYLVRQHGGRDGMKGRGAQRVTLVNLVFLFFCSRLLVLSLNTCQPPCCCCWYEAYVQIVLCTRIALAWHLFRCCFPHWTLLDDSESMYGK